MRIMSDLVETLKKDKGKYQALTRVVKLLESNFSEEEKEKLIEWTLNGAIDSRPFIESMIDAWAEEMKTASEDERMQICNRILNALNEASYARDW